MKKIVLAFVAVLALFSGSTAQADIHVPVTSGKVEPLPIAIMSFNAEPGSDEALAHQLPQVITSDLASTGLFEPVNSNAFIQDPASVHKDGAHFAEWRAINAKALVTGTISQ